MNANFAHRALTENEIFQKAPSVFSRTAHHSRSERFAPIATIDAVRALNGEGWEVTSAGQSVTRLADRQPFTKHMLRFRKPDDRMLRVDDNILELVLVNANDGAAAYMLDAGIFRIACLNGMIVKSADYGGIKVRHTGKAVEKVIEGSYEVLKNAERALTAPQDWGKIQLTERERFAFARGAAIQRWDADEHGNPNSPVGPDALLLPRRAADTGRDLWSTFNVLQENLTQGGLSGRTTSNRRTTTRQIRGIDQNVSVNKGLWEMADWLSTHAEQAKQAA